jgi:NAD-dependent DNA ligase
MWVVFLIVLVLGLAGFTYIAFKDKAALQVRYDEQVVKEQEAFAKYNEVSQKINELSGSVGFRESDTASSSVEAINDMVAGAKEKFPNHITTDVKTLDGIIEGMRLAYDDVEKKLGEARQNFENELELRRGAEETVNTVQDENRTRITELEGQLSDEQQRSQTQQDEDNQRISNLQDQLDDAEGRVRDAENTAMTQKERYEKEISLLNSRVSAMAKKLEVLREPDLPDGRILSTSSRSDLAYIDVGKKDGLRRGTKFEVFRYGKGGVLIPKGWVEVRDVEHETAKCGVLSTTDPLSPIVKGDVVVNPHFARNMEKTFVFLGEFPTSLSKGFVEDRLNALGARVAAKVDSNTDFLVLGDKEKGEFAPELSDLPEYKMAAQMGVQIMRLKELAAYIEF